MDALDPKEKELTRDTRIWKDSGVASVRFAAIGEKIGIWLTNRHRCKHNESGALVYRTVQSPCNDPAWGHWLCLTHQEHLVSARELGEHLSGGTHNLVWVCYRHGPEMEITK
jgi:hypothetical protein